MILFKNKKWLFAGVITISFIFFSISKFQKEGKISEYKEETTKLKKIETVVFGQWQPKQGREIIGVVESEQETDVLAQVNGTISQTYVNIGNSVYRGQILASFKKTNDVTQINYENALANKEAVLSSAENVVRSAKIALETATRDLVQAKLTEDQNRKQVFENLKTQTNNSETTTSNILNWIDRILGASQKYRFENITGRHEIGSSDRVNKQIVKNLTEELVHKFSRNNELSIRAKENDILKYGSEQLNFIRSTKKVLQKFDNLIHGTRVTSNFSEAILEGFRTRSAGYLTQINGEILALESTIENAKSTQKRSRLSIASVENRVRNAEAALHLADSNSNSQITAAENQVRIYQKSQKDLEIRAPFAGTIIEKFVSIGNQIMPGQRVFSVLGIAEQAKVSVKLTPDELENIQHSEHVKVQFNTNEIIEIPHANASIRINPESQKIQVEFPIATLPDNVYSGAFVKVLLPLNGVKSNLLPISSIAFEPDGAEVLVVDEAGITKRQNVFIGKVVANAVSIIEGLNDDDQVVRYRSQVYSGEVVEILDN